ncbi:MAG: CRTAC1 family protein, partial [Pirellulales bacterium]|nr:CRTAC1 family protein [Pirellulales bacterium]
VDDAQQNHASHGFAAVIVNFDGQQGNDLFIANDADRNHFWRSEPGSDGKRYSLVECAQLAGCATGLSGNRHGCMGVATGDFDRNGLPDLHVTNFWNQPADLYLQHSDGLFINQTIAWGIFHPSRQTVGWGTQAVDFDRDGWLDLAVLNGHVTDQRRKGIPYRMRPQIFRGTAGRFAVIDWNQLHDDYWTKAAHARTMAVLDWNQDGRSDLVTNHLNEPGALLENRTDAANWLQLELVGTSSERDAIGAEVRLHADGATLTGWLTGGDGFLCSNESMVDFGLGQVDVIEQLEVRWPTGTTQRFPNVRANQRYLAVEGQAELHRR